MNILTGIKTLGFFIVLLWFLRTTVSQPNSPTNPCQPKVANKFKPVEPMNQPTKNSPPTPASLVVVLLSPAILLPVRHAVGRPS